MIGCGVFFNQMYDLDRIVELCKPTTEAPRGYIDWIAPIMAPDQEAVQLNRREWTAWRKAIPERVKFVPWIVCDDPEHDYERARWVVDNYPSNGILFNAEKAYESTGKWKGNVLTQKCMFDPKLGPIPKILSYPSTPADRYDMDYRTFEKAGFWFAPQAYWLDPMLVTAKVDATPQNLYRMTYLPHQVHLNRDYRIDIKTATSKHWGRIVAWYGGTECTVKDMATAKLYKFKVDVHVEGEYRYMTAPVGRKLYDYKTGKIEVGQLLGFRSRDFIVPTVGYYPNCEPTPAQITSELNKCSILRGASLYLGDTSNSESVKAVWRAIYA